MKDISKDLRSVSAFSILALLLAVFGCAGVKNLSSLQHSVPGQNPMTKEKLTLYVTPIDQSNWQDSPDLLFKSEKIIYDKLNVLGNPPLAFKLEIVNQTGLLVRFLNCFINLVDLENRTYNPGTREALVQIWNDLKEPSGVSLANTLTLIDENTVVLPGKTITGYVTFNANPVGIKKCTFSIYDLVTETDEAGNPTKRSNFEFQFDERLVPAKR
jgi:hypothetical protein